MVKTIEVSFTPVSYGNQKTYHYLTDEDVVVGEKVIVDSPSDGYVAVRVVSIHEGETKKATKYIVGKINDVKYKARVEREKTKAKLIARLEQKKKEIEEEAIWKYLADQDSEAAELFKQLKELN